MMQAALKIVTCAGVLASMFWAFAAGIQVQRDPHGDPAMSSMVVGIVIGFTTMILVALA